MILQFLEWMGVAKENKKYINDIHNYIWNVLMTAIPFERWTIDIVLDIALAF